MTLPGTRPNRYRLRSARWVTGSRGPSHGHHPLPPPVRAPSPRPCGRAPLERGPRLRDPLAGHLRVRARSLEAPLVVLLLGPTGAGKSTIFNTIAGRPLSPPGVLRPTTGTAVVLASRDDSTALVEGPLGGLDTSQIQLVA